MSDYGIKPEEFGTITKNARDMRGLLFPCDRTEISIDDYVAIYRASYK
jgi:alcohol dehydrogenase